MRYERPGTWALAVASLALAGCGVPAQEEVHDWMLQQRAQPRPAAPPVPQHRTFQPQVYRGEGQPDPFSSQKLTQVLQRETPQSAASALLLAERARRRQPLEDVPLDVMTLVGSLMSRGSRLALVRVDKVVHAVPAGAYLGQNYGKVMKVTESQVVVREIVQDASGEWVERAALLQLQEAGR